MLEYRGRGSVQPKPTFEGQSRFWLIFKARFGRIRVGIGYKTA